MMKAIFLTSILFAIFSCGNTNSNLGVLEFETGTDSIKVYYLDWNLNTRVRLNSKDVKNYNGGRNAVHVVREHDDIIRLTNSFESSNMNLIEKTSNPNLRMVMEFYSDGDVVKEVYLNNYGHIFFKDGLYRNKQFYKDVIELIPATTAPF